jgi:hypothetical protein
MCLCPEFEYETSATYRNTVAKVTYQYQNHNQNQQKGILHAHKYMLQMVQAVTGENIHLLAYMVEP